MGQANLDLIFKHKSLDEVTKKLKKLKKEASSIPVGSNDKEINKTTKAIQNQVNMQKKHYEALKLNEKKDKDRIKLLEKQKYLLDKMGVGIKGKNGYEELNKSIDKYQAKVKKGIQLTQKEINSLKLLKAQTDKSKNSVNELASAYVSLQLAKSYIREISSEMQFLANLDQSIYNLGVVANKTTSEIETMKSEFLSMATKIPQSAIELADATDILARSGLEYQSALKTMEAGAQLATASGEAVADISKILSKALVAFKLNGESAQEATDSFFSTVLKTPLSLKGLSDGLKNSASAMSSFITFTKKAGGDLKEYKEDLLELNTALIGSSVSMGLNASQAGKNIVPALNLSKCGNILRALHTNLWQECA